EVSLLTAAETAQLVAQWNDTETAFDEEACVHKQVDRQCDIVADAVALIFGNSHHTYREFWMRTESLAAALRRCGVEPDTLVGLFLDRSVSVIESILAVLRCGGAYVPVDPAYPAARIGIMLKAVDVLLTQKAMAGLLPDNGATLLFLDELCSDQLETNFPLTE